MNIKLSEVGAVFISINDIEQAQLKLLCDDVFGENNFLTTMPKKGSGGRQDSKYFAVVHEYIVCYTKNKNKYSSGREEKEDVSYPLVDENGKEYKTQLLRKWGDNSLRENRPNLYYPIYFNKYNNTLDIERKREKDIEIFPMVSETQEGRWRWGKATMLKNMLSGKVEVKNKSGVYIPYERVYKPKEKQTKPFTTWIDDIDNKSGSALLKSIVEASNFDYPKPLDLIEKLLKMALPTTNYIALDFFAGSGTTGHAVMKLNAEDGGNRRFILCTNNENNICRDVTYERIKRVIDKENYAASLKYYKVEYIPISDRMYYEYADELLLHIRELVELENGVNFTGNDKIGIVLTEEELDDFISQLENNTKYQKLYLGHDILMDSQQVQILKNRKISINIIPDYYYKELEG